MWFFLFQFFRAIVLISNESMIQVSVSHLLMKSFLFGKIGRKAIRVDNAALNTDKILNILPSSLIIPQSMAQILQVYRLKILNPVGSLAVILLIKIASSLFHKIKLALTLFLEIQMHVILKQPKTRLSEQIQMRWYECQLICTIFASHITPITILSIGCFLLFILLCIC